MNYTTFGNRDEKVFKKGETQYNMNFVKTLGDRDKFMGIGKN